MNDLTKFGITMIVAIIFFFVCVSLSKAHEGYGFEHQSNPSGGIVMMEYCRDTGIGVWWHDHNLDGTVDTCTHAFMNHGAWHIKEIEPVDNKCFCEGED